MAQLNLFSRLLWSITDLTRYLRDLLESDELLQDVWVLGEVSNLSRPGSGHMYFTLKDAGASLRCVMWRPSVARLAFLPREGQALEAHGSLSIYETAGQYQLYVDALRPAGEGALYREFMRLKARLEGEGLFDAARKKPIPRIPRRIGVVTSPSGAALRDILNTLRRRFPSVEVVVSPTPVQGVEAPPGIVAAIERLNRIVKPDVILLARGGGSIEDLWAFNDELVARAIVASATPIITGIGHETDFTIADFASDLRAPTPTAAAELGTPSRLDLLAAVQDLETGLDQAISARLSRLQSLLGERSRSLSLRSPQSRVRTERQHIDDLLHRAETAFLNSLQVRRLQVGSLDHHLAALNPTSLLRRGFAIVRQRGNGLITSVAQVKDRDEIAIRLQDGEFPAVVGLEAPQHGRS